MLPVVTWVLPMETSMLPVVTWMFPMETSMLPMETSKSPAVTWELPVVTCAAAGAGAGAKRHNPLMRSPLLLLALFLPCACTSTDSTSSPDDASSEDATSDSGQIRVDAEAGVDAGKDAGRDSTGSGDVGDTGVTIDGGAEPAMVTASFSPSTASFLNPERGWMQGDGIRFTAGEDYSAFRSQGYTLVYGEGRLDAFRTTKTIDTAYTSAFDAALGKIRDAGVKVVLRFTYNDPNEGSTQDAALDVIQAHVAQLAPIVNKNLDVVALWQAGFIGQWGEWHDSTNGNDNPTSRKAVVDALLGALGPDRMIQVRTPMFKADWFPTALTPSQAFDGSEQARIGHHNDCFLDGDDDSGTYATPIDTWKKYVADDTQFTPHGGETCALAAGRTDCTSAQAEMKLLHTSFLNNHWNPSVIDGWTSGGCYDAIGDTMGYRIALSQFAYSGAVRPGGVLRVHVELQNVGWAAPFNTRDVRLVLTNGTTTSSSEMSPAGSSAAGIDWRSWSPSKPVAFDARFRIPATLAAGTYSLALWFPDASDAIRDRPEYAVRLANDGVWDDAHGWNVVTKTFTVDPKATGSYDPTASEFAVIP